MLTIEADGGSRGNPGVAGFGAIVLDDVGLAAELNGYVGRETNNVAEYNGLLAALEWCTTRPDDKRVHVRMDSRLVIEQMQGNWRINNDALRGLSIQCKNAIARGELEVTWEWIPRAENKRADRLANIAMDMIDGRKTVKEEKKMAKGTWEPTGFTAARSSIDDNVWVPRSEEREAPEWYQAAGPRTKVKEHLLRAAKDQDIANGYPVADSDYKWVHEDDDTWSWYVRDEG